jgi:hypothetical protein
MDLVIVPPEFAFLFFLPMIGFGLSLRQGHDLSTAVGLYLVLQIGLCILARCIYG